MHRMLADYVVLREIVRTAEQPEQAVRDFAGHLAQ